MRLLILIAFVILPALGCRSMSTTILNRGEFDSYERNRSRPEKGFPITVDVPTHLKVWIEEEYYVTGNHDHLNPVLLGGEHDRVIKIRSGYQFTEKLFMVDLKRPAVGTLKTDIQLDAKDQYFTSIHGQTVDNTIREITDIIGQFDGVLFAESKNASSDLSTQLIKGTRTLAFGYFDINSPGFEEELTIFLSRHINNCNYCKEWTPCRNKSHEDHNMTPYEHIIPKEDSYSQLPN